MSILKQGDFFIQGEAQLMADGRWGAVSSVTDHRGHESIDHKLLIDEPYFATSKEAEIAALDKGVDWLNQHFPV